MNKNKIIFLVFSILFSSFANAETLTLKVTNKLDEAQWVKIMFNLDKDRHLINYEPSGYKAREVDVTIKKNQTGQFDGAAIVYPEFAGQKGVCKLDLIYLNNDWRYQPKTTICSNLDIKLTK